MNIFQIIINFLMRLFKRKPQPFKGTAELTWLKEDSKEDSTKS